MLHSNTDLKWFRITRQRGGERSGGHTIMAYDEEYNNVEEQEKDEHAEPWAFSIDLRSSIATYYTENPNHGVKVIQPDTILNNNNEEIFTYHIST